LQKRAPSGFDCPHAGQVICPVYGSGTTAIAAWRSGVFYSQVSGRRFDSYQAHLASDAAIVVLNEDGSPRATITGETGAGGLALDGSMLYVARCDENTSDVIDITTLTKIGCLPSDVGEARCDLALAGHRPAQPTLDSSIMRPSAPA
jgi:hypothetical protein